MSTTYVSTDHTLNGCCGFEACMYLFVSGEIMKSRLSIFLLIIYCDVYSAFAFILSYV